MAQCVSCNKNFDQSNATHYDESVDPRNRWTCSSLCQKRLKKKSAKLRVATPEELEELGLDDVVDELGELSPATTAQAGIEQLEKEGAPETDDAPPFHLPGDSTENSLFAVAAKLAEAAALADGPVDKIVLGSASSALSYEATQRLASVLEPKS